MDETEKDLNPGGQQEETVHTAPENPAQEAGKAPMGGVAAAEAVEPQAGKRKGKKWIAIVAVVIVIAIILIAALGGRSSKNLKKRFSQYSGTEWCSFGEDGSWMLMDTNPDNMDNDDFDATYYLLYFTPCTDAIENALDELGFSSSVYQRMKKTTALQGIQSAETDKYTVSWSYHPDKGLEAMFEVK